MLSQSQDGEDEKETVCNPMITRLGYLLRLVCVRFEMLPGTSAGFSDFVKKLSIELRRKIEDA